MKFTLLLFLIPCFCVSLKAQRIDLVEGSLSNLKGVKSYNIEFKYDSNMVIGTMTPAKKYLEDKRSQWEQREPGKGAEFVSKWFDDRKKRYEPSFIINFEHYSGFKMDSNAKYTLVLKTTRTEGGWNAGIENHPGEIDGELLVVDSSEKTNVIARISLRDCMGKNATGGDLEMTNRIQSAYAAAGRWLGDFLRRKSK
jgi:hypothetical protein